MDAAPAPGPAREYGVLIRPRPGPSFLPEDVYRLSPAPNGTPGYVPLFRDADLARGWVAELRARNVTVSLVSVRDRDHMTDLLSRLRDEGVSHVSFDPRGAPPVLTPIAAAIIAFELSG